jgi:hypothetical protein
VPKRKPDIYKRARGYGLLNRLRDEVVNDTIWRPVPGFPEYEVNKNRQVRRVTTQHYLTPYQYSMRPNEGEFVEFWCNKQKYVMSLDAIMEGSFGSGSTGAAATGTHDV